MHRGAVVCRQGGTHDMKVCHYSPCSGRVSRARSALEGMRNSARRCLSGSWAVRYSAYSLLSWGASAPPMVVLDSAIVSVRMVVVGTCGEAG